MVELDPQTAGSLTLALGATVAVLTVYGMTRKHPFHASLAAGAILVTLGSWILNASLDQVAFLLTAYVLVVMALKVATSTAIMHSTFWLSLVLIGVAVLYVSVGAPVLAAVQILIYVGAVITLILFTVIMTTPEVEEEERAEVIEPVVDETHTGAPPASGTEVQS